MRMRRFARVQDGRVAEVTAFTTDPVGIFHPDLCWVEVAEPSDVALGWLYDGTRFSEPVDRVVPSPEITLAGLQAQLAALTARIAALSDDRAEQQIPE